MTSFFAEPAFQQMSRTEGEAVLSWATKKTLRSGAPVYCRGDQPDGLYIVLNDLIRVTGISRDGDEFILDLCGPGFWIGEITVLGGSAIPLRVNRDVRSGSFATDQSGALPD